MKVGELKELISKFKDDSEVLLFPNSDEFTNELGENESVDSGIAVFEDDELIYLDAVEMIELTDEIYKWVVKFAKKEI